MSELGFLDYANCKTRTSIQQKWDAEKILDLDVASGKKYNIVNDEEFKQEINEFVECKKQDPYEPDKNIDKLYLFVAYMLTDVYILDGCTTSISLSGGIKGGTRLYTIKDTLFDDYNFLMGKKFIIKHDTEKHARALNALYVSNYYNNYHQERMHLLSYLLHEDPEKYNVKINNKFATDDVSAISTPLTIKTQKVYYYKEFSIEEYIDDLYPIVKHFFSNKIGLFEMILSLDFLVNDDDACNALNILMAVKKNTLYAIDLDQIYNNDKSHFMSSIYQTVDKDYIRNYYDSEIYKKTMPTCLFTNLDIANDLIFKNKYLKYKNKYLQLKKLTKTN